MEHRDEKGTQGLWARVTASGGVLIQGQDLGPRVEEVFGFSEYEWDIDIAKEDVPALKERLGGRPEDDVLDLLSSTFAADPYFPLESKLEEWGLKFEFWNRIGD